MIFNEFYPSSIASNSPFFVGRSGLLSKEFNKFFRELKKLNEDDLNHLGRSRELIDQCDSLLHRKLLDRIHEKRSRNPNITPSNISTMEIASLFAVKMKICNRHEELKTEIRKDYGNFLKAIFETRVVKYELREDLNKSSVTVNFQNLLRDITPALESPVVIKNGRTDISVPDFLASKTKVSGHKLNGNQIRKMYHKLWDKNSIRPLLEIIAHRSIFDEGSQIVFYNAKLEQYGEVIQNANNTVVIKTHEHTKNGEKIILPKEILEGTIAHEFHHASESIINKNKDCIPYHHPNSTFSNEASLGDLPYNQEIYYENLLPEPKTAVKERLRLVREEANKIPYTHHDDPLPVASVRIPNEGFNFLGSLSDYSTLQYSYSGRMMQNCEVVVLASQTLAQSAGYKGLSEEFVLETMRSNGLINTLLFFEEEMQKMRSEIEELRKTTGMVFVDAQDIGIIPDYLEYQSTEAIENIRNNRPINILEIDVSEKDSLGNTLLDVAIDLNKTEIIFHLCIDKRMKNEYVGNPFLLEKTTSHLIDLARYKECSQEDKKAAVACLIEVRGLLKDVNSLEVSEVLRNSKFYSMDQGLKKTLSPNEILATIKDKDFQEIDGLGNSYFDYVADAYIYQAYTYQEVYKKLEDRSEEWIKVFKEISEMKGVPQDKKYGVNDYTIGDLFFDANHSVLTPFCEELNSAINLNRTEIIFPLCVDERMKNEYIKIPSLLKKTTSHLIDLTRYEECSQEDKKAAVTCLVKIRESLQDVNSPTVSKILCNSKFYSMDQDLRKTLSPDAILTTIKNENFQEMDDLGNSYFDYVVDAYIYQEAYKKLEDRSEEWGKVFKEISEMKGAPQNKKYGVNDKTLEELLIMTNPGLTPSSTTGKTLKSSQNKTHSESTGVSSV